MTTQVYKKSAEETDIIAESISNGTAMLNQQCHAFGNQIQL